MHLYSKTTWSCPTVASMVYSSSEQVSLYYALSAAMHAKMQIIFCIHHSPLPWYQPCVIRRGEL